MNKCLFLVLYFSTGTVPYYWQMNAYVDYYFFSSFLNYFLNCLLIDLHFIFLRVAVAGHKMTGCTIGILTLGGKTVYRFSPSFQSQTK